MAEDSPAVPTPPQLRLFVVGSEPHSMRARENIERLLAEEQFRNLRLDVVDVLTDYRAALDNSVLIAPTLIITSGSVRIAVAGDMSDSSKLKSALETL